MGLWRVLEKNATPRVTPAPANHLTPARMSHGESTNIVKVVILFMTLPISMKASNAQGIGKSNFSHGEG